LNKQRPGNLPPLNICLQVDLDNEPQKGGITPSELPAIATEIAKLPHLKLRGLMCIPKARDSLKLQTQCFKQLTALQDELNTSGLSLDTLSMGMSKDLDAAIAAGSTMLRIGSDIFGARD
jgi:hypothetical protein